MGGNGPPFFLRDCSGDFSELIEVILWKLSGAGHVWPGGKQKFMERLLGPSTDIIDANAEMWNFFKRFSL